HARGGRRNLGVHLVRGDLEERLVPLDRVADLLEPLGQRPLGDGLTHLGHHDVYACHRITLVASSARVFARGVRARSSPPAPAPLRSRRRTARTCSNHTVHRFLYRQRTWSQNPTLWRSGRRSFRRRRSPPLPTCTRSQNTPEERPVPPPRARCQARSL